jgi:hypothetical protein
MCPKVDIWRIGSPKDVGRICLMYTFLTFGVGLRKAGSGSPLPRLCEYPVLTTPSGGAAAWLNQQDAPKSTKIHPNIYQKTRSAFLVL